MRSNLLSVSVFLLLILSHCSKIQKGNINSEFQSLFIDAKAQSPSRFIRKVTSESIDSLIMKIHENAGTGTFADTLTDTTGTQYLIGYRTPEIIKKDTSYPLVIYLHGGTGTEINTKGEHAFEMLSPMQDSMEIFLVSPSANRNARWWNAAGISRILQTLRFMTFHYPIDTSKVFLAGVSDGATGCWAAANCIAGPFAGFFAISGYGGILPSTGMQLYPENIMQRPIYSVNAGNDRLYSLDMVNNFLDYLSGKGVEVIRKSYPDEQHGFDYREKEFGTLCAYIRSWSRPSFQGFRWQFVQGVPNIPPNILQCVTNSSEKVSLRGYYKADTLSLQATGISSLILNGIAPDQNCFVSVNNSPVKHCKQTEPPFSTHLQIARQTGFPFFNKSSFISI
ncbi:MAG: hypothetical protein GX640_15720, partial [Fibrobacter sp.]|nr:hypothetical protein [Fibrobacter sp.]